MKSRLIFVLFLAAVYCNPKLRLTEDFYQQINNA